MKDIYIILIPFLGTSLGAACVFFMKNSLSDSVERSLTGFAAGVMIAASVWSLLIPAIEQSENMGKWSFIPAVTGFWAGVLFLLLLDRAIPHLHRNSEKAEGPKSKLQRTTMMVLAVTLHNIPEGYEVPEGRVKPWGTGHAVLSCINEIDGPFVVINADDYYGSHAFKMAYDFLTENEDTADTYRYMMVGYKLENTLTENGHVARGVCVTDEEGHLLKINERTHIEKHDGGTAYTEDDGKTWTMLPEGSTVSMNMWGFSASILKELKDRFPKFLDENLKVNPLKCEYFLPFVVDELLGEKRATVKVLKSMDKWYGVTYKEDKPVVVAAIQNLKDGGLYPQKLWEE